MTPRVLARPQLSRLVPPLFSGFHTVALITTTTDRQWSAAAAWDFARAAATGERRVVLVDLSGPDETLAHAGEDAGAARGIADAFRSDEPLDDLARAQEQPGLLFIARGTGDYPADELWRHPRWPKLARGFASQGAMLLLYAPPGALGALPLDLDSIVLLAPRGFDPATGALPALSQRLSAGAVPLVVVAEEPATPEPARAARPGIRRAPLTRPRSTRERRGRGAIGLLIAGGIIASAVGLWARRSDTDAATNPPGPASLPFRDDAGDSLYYSVQVAAFNTLEQAVDQATAIERDGLPAIVTPVRVGSPGLWYRVLVGALATPRAADSLRQELWRSGRLVRPQGTILRAPDAFRVGRAQPAADAAATMRGLRARGVPAYIVAAADGLDRVYVGAFDLPEQAPVVDSLLSAAGVSGTLSSRMGTSR